MASTTRLSLLCESKRRHCTVAPLNFILPCGHVCKLFTILISSSPIRVCAAYPDETNPLATHILSKQATFHSRIVQEFASTLPSLDAIESIESSDSRRTFAVVYCLMNGTLMLLYQKLAQAGEPEAARICLHAADEVARVFEKRDGSSLGLLDPVLGVCAC